MLREHLFDADPAQVGLEIELNLVDSRGMPSMRNAAVLDAIADPPGRPSSGSSTSRSTCRPGSWSGGAVADQEQEVRASLNAADTKAREHRQPPGHDRHPADAERAAT